MKQFLFVLLAISFVEHSYQDEVLDIGPIIVSAKLGPLPPIYTNLTANDQFMTDVAWKRSQPLWNSIVRGHDPLVIDNVTILLSDYQLYLTNVVISGRALDELQYIQVRQRSLGSTIRVDARSFVPQLNISAQFELSGPGVFTNLYMGIGELFYTNVTHIVGLAVENNLALYNLSGQQSTYSIGDVKARIHLEYMNTNTKKSKITSFIKDHNQEVLEQITRVLHDFANTIVNTILPFPIL